MPFIPATECLSEEVESRVIAAFRSLGYLQLEWIDCRVNGGTAYLRGEINSFYLKQVAQSVTAHVPGVRRVENYIEVQDHFGQLVQ